MPERTALQRSLLCGVLALLAGTFFPSPAKADSLDLSLADLPSSVSAGDTGSFEVVLTDVSGTSGVTIAGFDFELDTSSSDVTLTDANTSTSDPYIFALPGNSLANKDFGGDLVILNPPLIANDEALSGGTMLTAGQSVALGEVFFSVSPTASTEQIGIDFLPDFTDLSDPAGNAISIDSATGGTLTIMGSTTVPEPPSGVMLLCGLLVISFTGRRSRLESSSHSWEFRNNSE